MQDDKLLSILADLAWHPGEQLAGHFQLSRTAIWKRIAHLREQGLTIEADRGKGYRLRDPVQWFSLEKLSASLQPSVRECLRFDIEKTIDSTNRACLRLIEQAGQSPTHGYVQLAEQQTGGKGRRGRRWTSPPGCNIYVSLVWRFEGGASSLSGLSLAVGLAIVTALERQGYAGLQLKWPNDILWQGRKLAGILLEMSGDVAGACDVVIGFGVNVAMPKAVDKEIDQPWVDLAEIAPNLVPDKNKILAGILNELFDVLQAFKLQGFTHLRERWEAYDAYNSASVRLTIGADGQAGAQLEGIYRGVNTDGSITLEIGGELRQFSGGELSLRKI
ncbi:MAG: bifunctional biotin--[acetyl-CoA-carboxylase] ligase/biotin operon repressor BirA [Gammaproteobacteria bacterium]|nr:bifunctional biotin--[acetyl-CoA-carboxylase] ligase/biotin operon repressor BirA [Gammaproteobacteria bacterium]MBT8151708.1 bifunctional biotin--[acetyl-CoA-carboxylase] ligase/biotin operon repressor BirA [Gammaproteobacteria bacterium]NND39383.1 bifunctional biotin--[acetyl-CoA-carboxylase] ligase/biotin operon repressor BirA [Pseudomonadales bacterium]RZV53998.1 MAG: bifunctional biotin--[acetyl-CoA-carboxylase] ligase/biotin operon repressor BirA [Pseudomonadales bacterium]